ncbi:uncharacterized protein LOC121919189 [Sceloporus undulatus]|uniref:uncharacterized protein LOC121919189 n=1 Tax=Sceloporus undulatus TaxID=8520 RepID=UPI001C4D5AAE|nr:uncharacterized protein LOC121919189 [Sceloporus undulatus]
MGHILSLLWPGQLAEDLYYAQEQKTNEGPETYMARKMLLARIAFPSKAMNKEFMGEIYRGLHPKSKESLGHQIKESELFAGWETFSQHLRQLSSKFHLMIAQRQEKSRAPKKKARENSLKKRFLGPSKSPTQPSLIIPQREMETPEGLPHHSKQKLPETPKGLHSKSPYITSCSVNLRKASPPCPNGKKNVSLSFGDTSATVRTTVYKQRDQNHTPNKHSEAKRVKALETFPARHAREREPQRSYFPFPLVRLEWHWEMCFLEEAKAQLPGKNSENG